MKLLSWNVNGIRSVMQKGFLDFVAREQPAVLCLQETKVSEDKLEPAFTHIDGYDSYWAFAEKKGYSGVATYTRVPPVAVEVGLGIPEVDREGRVVTLEFSDYFIVNVYSPNSQAELGRLDFRLNYEKELLAYLQKLRKTKPVLLCGDLNVAHQPIDLTHPKANEKSPGYTIEEREAFGRLLDAGYLDSFRLFNQEGGNYSWWSFRSQARAKNVGWRIDYWVLCEELKDRIESANILPEVFGSDHCPVGLQLK